jgi:hypothetical protein
METIEKLACVTVIALAVLISVGCSFQVEVGYHGQTGRDDRTQTQLVKAKAAKSDY